MNIIMKFVYIVANIFITIKVVNIGTDMCEQTVQTQIRMLSGSLEHSDQGLHCLLMAYTVICNAVQH